MTGGRGPARRYERLTSTRSFDAARAPIVISR